MRKFTNQQIEEEDNYSDEEFNFGLNEFQEMSKALERREAAQTKQLLDDAIVDEVEEELFEDELLTTEIGKNDAKKLKELIGNIDLGGAIGKNEPKDIQKV